MAKSCAQLEEDFKHEIMGPMTGDKEFSPKAVKSLVDDLKRSSCSFDASRYAKDTAKEMTNFLMNSKNIDNDMAANIAETIDNIEKLFK